jgi:hypothetical protein
LKDPKDYRFCGYAEAVVGEKSALDGLRQIWVDFDKDALRVHRLWLFGKGGAACGKVSIDRAKTLKVLEQEDGLLPKAAILRCRVRYFTDGAIFGSAEFVRSYAEAWQLERKRRFPPKVNALKGADWGNLAVIQGLRRHVFG